MEEGLPSTKGQNQSASLGHPEAPRASRRALLLRLFLAGAAVLAVILLGRFAGGYFPRFAEWVNELGFWGPVVFIAGYALATVALIPGSLLTLAAGAIFGILKGTLYVYIAATIGSSAAFLISRSVARSAVERRIAANPKFATIDRTVRSQGWKIVVLLRLSPLFPFNLLNYALGLTNVRFADYLAASVGMIPGTLLYVYYGKLAGDVATLASGMKMEKDAAYYIRLVVGLVATIVVTTMVARIAQKALKEATAENVTSSTQATS